MAAMSDTTKQILEYASITHLKCRIGRLTRCETDKKNNFYGTKETYGRPDWSKIYLPLRR